MVNLLKRKPSLENEIWEIIGENRDNLKDFDGIGYLLECLDENGKYKEFGEIIKDLKKKDRFLKENISYKKFIKLVNA